MLEGPTAPREGSRITAFNLPPWLSKKSLTELIRADDNHFKKILDAMDRRRNSLNLRLSRLRSTQAGLGQGALERDLEIHQLSAQLRVLERYGAEVVLGRMIRNGDPYYLGRLGLTDDSGEQLLIDWRTSAAEPFFLATLEKPLGLSTRRRYRWDQGKVVDYWDEILTPDQLSESTAPDDQSSFLSSLGADPSGRMRDVLGMISADQDQIVRAPSSGQLIVAGGPGTGKTVVALHRAAYLMYSDNRIHSDGGGVLFVAPHRPYLDFAADILPNLGEDRVVMATYANLVPEGAHAVPEVDHQLAALKGRLDPEAILERATKFYEQPPTIELIAESPWGEVTLTTQDWADVFAGAPDSPHNEARDQVWELVVETLLESLDSRAPDFGEFQTWAASDDAVAAPFSRAWPILNPAETVSDLWSVPAYLRLAAPELAPSEVVLLTRKEGSQWTIADLPLLDAAHRRIGDPAAVHRRRAAEARHREESSQRRRVTHHLIAADDTEMQVMSMLHGADLQSALLSEDWEYDPLQRNYAHVVVDEAQELTDAQWRMLSARCPSGSFTIAGDRAQARNPFPESWSQRLARVGLHRPTSTLLRINYRTPVEIMAAAEPVIRSVLPNADVPASVRLGGQLHNVSSTEVVAVVQAWLKSNSGRAGVINLPRFPKLDRVTQLTSDTSKGLEFALVVLADGGAAVDQYVAMTRATQTLLIVRH